jgi:hypothetical protein
MRRTVLPIAALVFGLAAAPSALPAGAGFSGNVCGLLAAKQVAAIVGDASASKYACTAQKSIKTPAGTTYQATAGPSSPAAGGFLSIQVVKYSSPKVESLVQAQYEKSMKPLAHVGDWAYSRSMSSPVRGGTAAMEQLAFGADGYGVLVIVRAKLGQSGNQAALKTLAASIAKQL